MLRPGRQVHLSGQSLAFRGCKPHISLDCSQARGRSVRRALDQGHFYLQVEKKGSIFRQTTCPAYQTFTVSPDWVTGLWQGDKINKECAEQHYVQCKRNIRAYCENLKYHGQKQRELYIQQQQAAAAELLCPLQKEPVELPEVTQLFLPQFTRPMHRRKFLVLNGPTRLGRLSMHGLSLAQITRMKPIVPGCWSPTWGNMMCYGTGVWCLMKLVSILSWSTKNCFRRRLPKLHLGTRRQACMFIASGFGMSLLLSHPMSGPPNWSSSLKKIGNG